MSALHYRAEISNFPGSYAMLSDGEVTTAVVFVHGHHGCPFKTWLQFQVLVDTLVEESEWWATCDLFFFAYESVSKTIKVSSTQLLSFLDSVYLNPNQAPAGSSSGGPSGFHMAVPNTLRRSRNSYANLILVGHSQGAVIIRKAILDVAHDCEVAAQDLISRPIEEDPSRAPLSKELDEIHRSAREWSERMRTTSSPELEGPVAERLIAFASYGFNVPADIRRFALLQSQLCLFAPAHLGASVSGWAGVFLALPVISSLSQYSTSQVELRQASPVLGTLKEETERLARSHPAMKALRGHVLWGADEKIVFVGSYQGDHEADPVPGHNHTSICKPTYDFREPLRFAQYGKARGTAAV